MSGVFLLKLDALGRSDVLCFLAGGHRDEFHDRAWEAEHVILKPFLAGGIPTVDPVLQPRLRAQLDTGDAVVEPQPARMHVGIDVRHVRTQPERESPSLLEPHQCSGVFDGVRLVPQWPHGREVLSRPVTQEESRAVLENRNQKGHVVLAVVDEQLLRKCRYLRCYWDEGHGLHSLSCLGEARWKSTAPPHYTYVVKQCKP